MLSEIDFTSIFLKYKVANKTVTMEISTGIIDSNNGRLLSRKGKSTNAIPKGICHTSNPYRRVFFSDVMPFSLNCFLLTPFRFEAYIKKNGVYQVNNKRD